MAFIKKLIEWLSFKPRRIERKWDPTTNPIDVQKIARDLRLKEEGARLGAAGVPLDSESALCGPESQAILAIEQARTDYVEWGQLRLKSLDGELTRLNIGPNISAATESAAEFQRLAAAAITANATEISRLQSEAESRQGQFERFRTAHRRLDIPHFPTGLAKAIAWILPISLITLEALLNASFFAKGLTGGLLDGFTEALIAACLNVAVCLFIGGTCVRFVNHVKLFPMLFGMLATGGVCSFIVALALVVAHYREALVLGVNNAQSAAIATFLSQPFTLLEISSWYLFLIGVVFGVIAVIDGYKLDDPYPGYGKNYRQTSESVLAYENALGQLHAYLEELKVTMLAKVEYAFTHSATSIVSFKNIIADKDRCKEQLPNMINDSPAMLAALLAEFRDENIVARKSQGHGIPPSFSVKPLLHSLVLPNFDTKNDRMSLSAQEALLAEFVLEAPAIRAQIQNGYITQFNSLHTLSNHFSGRGITSKVANPVSTDDTKLTVVGGV